MSNVTGRIFDLGRLALLASQQGINVTGHNISNVNTPGYSRQRLVLETNQPIDSSYGQVGAGVRAETIERVHDRFLARQINDAQSPLGMWEARKEIMTQAEFVFNESTGVGLNNSMESFWNAWQDVSNNPSGLTEREVLLTKADTMARDFNSVYTRLGEIQSDTRTLIDHTIDDINELAEEITDLNGRINRIEAGGQNANDLQDQRDERIKELANLIDIDTIQGDGGLVYVSASQYPLVIGLAQPEPITLENVQDTLTGGKLKGYVDAYDEVNAYKENVKLLAHGIRDQVNGQHQTGYDLFGESADPGVNANAEWFFDPDAEVLELGISDYKRVAAASTADAEGDNDNAISIYALRNQSMGPEVTSVNVSGTGEIAPDFTNFTLSWDDDAQKWSILRGDTANNGPFTATLALPADQASFVKINFDLDNDGLQDKSVEITLTDPLTYDVELAFDVLGGDIVYKQDRTPQDFYAGLVAGIGNDVENSDRNVTHSTEMTTQLDNYRESISGVNMDEEMVALIQFQNAYQAAAKIISAVDEILDTLMNMV